MPDLSENPKRAEWRDAAIRPASAAEPVETYESGEDRVRNDLTRRPKGVCEKLSREDFDALILRMTREQLRGEGISKSKTRPC
ncbi:MAG: hypothetical protein M3Z54_10515 [Gemmatimonadota bacterium]|nr:hypothetical protein [Gemmatimonadota bacterium]